MWAGRAQPSFLETKGRLERERERETERERRGLGGVESATKPFVGKSLPRLGITIFSLTERGSRKFRVSRKGMMRVRKK